MPQSHPSMNKNTLQRQTIALQCEHRSSEYHQGLQSFICIAMKKNVALIHLTRIWLCRITLYINLFNLRKWQPYKSIIVNRQKPSKDKKLLLNLSVITFYWWWMQMWCSWQLLRWCWWWWWDGFPYNRYFSCFCRHINCKCNKVRYMIIVFRSFRWLIRLFLSVYFVPFFYVHQLQPRQWIRVVHMMISVTQIDTFLIDM